MQLSGHTVIYGGSFDPPHMSHQISCLYLLEGLGAAAVWVMPAASHPFGKTLTAFATRFAMCELLAAPFGGRVVVMPTEQDLGGANRTFDTLCHLRAHHPEHKFALAVGADILPDTPRWYRWDAITTMVPIVVLGRHGYPNEAAKLVLPAVSSTQIRARCQSGASLEGAVPGRVIDFIQAHGLYR